LKNDSSLLVCLMNSVCLFEVAFIVTSQPEFLSYVWFPLQCNRSSLGNHSFTKFTYQHSCNRELHHEMETAVNLGGYLCVGTHSARSLALLPSLVVVCRLVVVDCRLVAFVADSNGLFGSATQPRVFFSHWSSPSSFWAPTALFQTIYFLTNCRPLSARVLLIRFEF
jgi:hypothetical protein